jgi:lipoprotein NlpD
MPQVLLKDLRCVATLAACVVVVGCANTGGRAPVEDRSPAASRPAAPMVVAPSAPAVPKLNAEHAGKPGYYTVRPGDTMARIALDHGQNWRDVTRWNGLENPNVIEVGQVLRVVPPHLDSAAVAQPVASTSRIDSRPLETRPATPAPGAAVPTPAVSAASAAPAAAPSAGSAAAAAPPREGDDDVNWQWPSGGPLLAGFDEGRNVKGLAIGGKAGDPVLAAADGRVVYAGSGLRGYGNLVILKHNNTYLTAYAHNQNLLVREDQVVRRGQRIAEMGSSDAERVQLHFEIRRLGKPVDPARLLPSR